MEKPRLSILDLGLARAYALSGERGTVLVDSGSDGSALEAALLRADIDPAKILLAILTHAHNDHFGGLPWLAERKPGLALAVGAADADALERGQNADLLPLGAKGKLAALFSQGERVFRSPAATLRFEGGESLSAYGIEAEVVATPGHTKGSISVFLPAAMDCSGRELGPLALVGDLVMGGFVFHGRPQLPFFGSGPAEIAASLEKLLVRGTRTLLPGHGGPLVAERTFRKLGRR